MKEGTIFGIGSPLLDISVNTDETFLEKYGLEPNDCILAKDCHKKMYDDLINNYDVEFIAGGSAQNTIRVAQWVIGKPLATVFFGCIGTDKFGEILEEKTKEIGVDCRFQYHSTQPTGTAAVIITSNGLCRSMCAYLAASGGFTQDHLEKVENYDSIQKAQFYYTTGYFLNVDMKSVMMIAEHAQQNNKVLSMNLSSPYISIALKKELMTVMPYVDILFGNEAEAATFGKEQNFGVTDLKEIAQMITYLPKINTNRSRMVIITQGENPIIIAKDNEVKEYEVNKLNREELVDTNGAGDAFVGGFLAQLAQNQSIEVCVKCGIFAATEIIKTSGCSLPNKPFSEVYG